MAKYSKYSYLYPLRPETVVTPSMLKMYDSRGWWWQAKMNGTCTIIFTDGNQVIFKNRHGEDHKAWRLLRRRTEPARPPLRRAATTFSDSSLLSDIVATRCLTSGLFVVPKSVPGFP